VRQIHDAGVRFALAITGGGSQAISALLTTPGGSRTVLEVLVPYSARALGEFLGARPEQFCSQHTARLMAMAAYERARELAGNDGRQGSIAGIGCTASLVSDRPKRGAHRIHVAAQTGEFTAVASLELTKGARGRTQEEELAALLVLNMVARACRLSDRLALQLSAPKQVVEDVAVAPSDWQALFVGKVNVVLCRAPRRHLETGAANVPEAMAGESIAGSASKPGRAIFPGAFHPLHDGHRQMARLAAEKLGAPVEWELSITNVDKPLLDFYEMRSRAEQFPAGTILWLTRAPTFVEKAEIFPGATFIVGADTIARIAEPRYYAGDRAACDQALAAIAAAGCRFLVFGRRNALGRFESLADLELPAILRGLCDEVLQDAFRADVSSTEMRRTEAGDE
jgi:hypothetical protein